MLRAALAALALLALPALPGWARAAETVVRLSFETKENWPRYLGEGTTIQRDKPGVTIELLRMVDQVRGRPHLRIA